MAHSLAQGLMWLSPGKGGGTLIFATSQVQFSPVAGGFHPRDARFFASSSGKPPFVSDGGRLWWCAQFRFSCLRLPSLTLRFACVFCPALFPRPRRSSPAPAAGPQPSCFPPVATQCISLSNQSSPGSSSVKGGTELDSRQWC